MHMLKVKLPFKSYHWSVAGPLRELLACSAWLLGLRIGRHPQGIVVAMDTHSARKKNITFSVSSRCFCLKHNRLQNWKESSFPVQKLFSTYPLTSQPPFFLNYWQKTRWKRISRKIPEDEISPPVEKSSFQIMLQNPLNGPRFPPV